ncbi:MAG TPA: hypothetical protein VES93_11785 [Ornithinibacter sp.]|nr:hypothetical protein [Ornithinibacter sp.]
MSRARTDDPGTWQVPDVAALQDLAPSRSGGRGALGHPRRVVATLLAFPLLLWLFRTSLPPQVVPSAGWWVLLAAVSALAALTLATYLPVPGAIRGGASPCAAAAVVFVVLAAVALGSARSTALSGIPALALAAMALGQRLLGAAACPPRPR